MNDQKKLLMMTEGGHLLAEVRSTLAHAVTVGMKLVDLDSLAEKLLIKTGGEPAFKRVKDYYWSTCINVNNGIVHGIPNEYEIQEGDTVAIDVGLYYKGYNTDTSLTVPAGDITQQQKDFLIVGKKALQDAIAMAIADNRVWHISKAMQDKVESAGFSVVRELTGHGIGKELHDSPHVPCFAEGRPEDTMKLFNGQTLALEVIYTMGSPELILEADGWTISTRDGKMAGLFEETVAITNEGPIILTK